jgi:hypothetical protein
VEAGTGGGESPQRYGPGLLSLPGCRVVEVDIAMNQLIKVGEGISVCPSTFEVYGPYCATVRWDITDFKELEDWVRDNVTDADGYEFWVKIDSSRMIRYPLMFVYMKTLDQLTLFKLTFA